MNEYQVTVIQANGSWTATKVNAPNRRGAVLLAMMYGDDISNDIASITVEESEAYGEPIQCG